MDFREIAAHARSYVDFVHGFEASDEFIVLHDVTRDGLCNGNNRQLLLCGRLPHGSEKQKRHEKRADRRCGRTHTLKRLSARLT